MVLLQTEAARGASDASATEIDAYVRLARGALTPPAPVLIAVGGYSGSGKSVLSRALAADQSPMPGAVLISSDLERKTGRPITEKLNPSSYSAEQRGTIYQTMLDRAETILTAGHSVMLDATFIDHSLRQAAERVADKVGVPFYGFWMHVAPDELERRVRARQGDASDADAGVLWTQLKADVGPMRWLVLEGGLAPELVLQAAQVQIHRSKTER